MTTPEIHSVIQVLQKEVEEAQNENLAKVAGIQHDNATYGHTQARLETQLYAQEQEMDRLKKEVQMLTRSRKESDKKLAQELQNFENDRMRWQQREADLYNQVRSLSANGGEPRTPRTPRRRSVTATTMSTTMSPFTGYTLNDIGEHEQAEEAMDLTNLTVPKLAPIDSSYGREAKIAQRTIKAQDKLILDLKNEVEKQKGLGQDQSAEAQRQSLRIEHLEHEIINVKQVNRSLMEDNESYQILLHEKTISGEFMMNPIMQVEDGLDQHLKPSSSTSSTGFNLAAELNMAGITQLSESEMAMNKLNEENKTLTDTNRALQLYMNKILMKIINNKQLEDVLSIDQPKPRTSNENLKETSNNQKSMTQVTAGPGPVPTRTLSTSLAGKATGSTTANNRQQRRRTISYWGSKAAPVIPTSPLPTPSGSLDKPTTTTANTRRHSSNAAKEPERPNGGWAKALRRMSVIGWSGNANAKPEENSIEPTPGSSSSSDENESSSSDSGNKLLEPEALAPSLSRSGSSTTSSSLRRSNELATLEEE
ncbi:hypothetical protein J3Q64DRAFT_1811565 [Phycomyces blakesleeanus]|uniref:Uncharacterized protein n=1 Tax=Phycomyces blakesleeanus TaxID=4837 RepID=A0ABR3AIU7_PHYBL